MYKKIIVFTSSLLFILFINAVQAEALSAIGVIQSFIDDIDKNKWSEIPNWWTNDQGKDLSDFMKNKENQKYKRGLFNIKQAKLVRWKELPYEYAKNYLPTRYMEKFENPRVFYVGVDYKVYKQNNFFINGINYFFIVVVLQEGEWKIALTPHIPVSSIIYDGYGFGTEDEKTFDDRRLKYINAPID